MAFQVNLNQPDDENPAENPGSVSLLIDQLQQGENDAVADLWHRYFQRLVPLARKKLGTAPRRIADEEDVALSVINHLVNGAARGCYPELEDRDELWKLLVVITQRKVFDQIRHQQAKKRGGKQLRGESIFLNAGDDSPVGWEAFMNENPTPEALALMDERCRQLLDQLEDPLLKQIAQLKLESYTNEEIAEKLQVTSRTVKRKCRLIKDKWAHYAESTWLPDFETETDDPA